MAVEINKTNTYHMRAKTEDGNEVTLTGVEETNGKWYNVTELNGKVSIMSLFEVLGKVSKSGKDNVIVGNLIELTNRNNEIHIPNIGKFANSQDASRETVKRLLKRVVDNELLHKLDTGHYMLNPYIIMSKGLTNGGYKLQENVQIQWRKVTGLLTDTQFSMLVDLSNHLGLETGLRATEFNLSVALYYSKKGEITDKQRKVLMKG